MGCPTSSETGSRLESLRYFSYWIEVQSDKEADNFLTGFAYSRRR